MSTTPPDDSDFVDQLQKPIRIKSRAYGVGKYGKGKYSQSDATKYAWSRVAGLILTLAVMVLLPASLGAVNAICDSGDTQTTNLTLCKPALDVEGSIFWGTKANNNYDILDLFYAQTVSSMNVLSGVLLNNSIPWNRLSNGSVVLTTSTDKVGISTNAPQGTLDVNGSLYVKGGLAFSTIPYVSVGWGNPQASLTDGTTIFVYFPTSSITLNKICATIITADNSSTGTDFSCGVETGARLNVRTRPAQALGTVSCTTGTLNVVALSTVSCYMQSNAASKPITNNFFEYRTQ